MILFSGLIWTVATGNVHKSGPERERIVTDVSGNSAPIDGSASPLLSGSILRNPCRESSCDWENR